VKKPCWAWQKKQLKIFSFFFSSASLFSMMCTEMFSVENFIQMFFSLCVNKAFILWSCVSEEGWERENGFEAALLSNKNCCGIPGRQHNQTP
jgi:hypothetical protein